MKKVVYVTGSRSEFGLMLSTLKEIDDNPNLDLSLIITGMHLSEKHGNSVEEVKRSDIRISKIVPINSEYVNNPNKRMSVSTGKAIIGMSEALCELRPDILLLEGDRHEALAAAISAAMLNIPIAHVSGGDVSRSIDDSIRHAITRFAHLHFPGTKESAERIIKMGEESWRVHMVGTPVNKEIIPINKLESKLGLRLEKDVLLVIQHPVTTESHLAGEHMKKTLEAVKKSGKQIIIIYPNTDAGSEDIIKVLESYKDYERFFIYKNLLSKVFTSLLSNVKAIVGNSSAGIVEAPMFNLPCINIGIRQEGRETAGNVINVNHDVEKIIEAINFALSASFKGKISLVSNPYSFDDVGGKIARVLEDSEINERLLTKKITY